jgi:nitrogen fixation NifU-like protein
MDKNAIDVGTGLVGAPACGDVMKLQVQSLAPALIAVPLCEVHSNQN